MNNLEVRWIIEKDVLSYTGRLVEYLEKKDIYYKETTYQEIISYSYEDKYGHHLQDFEVATIFVGSLRLAKEISRYPIFPGAICNLKNFDCLNYYPSWSPYLLNKDCTLTMKFLEERILNTNLRGKGLSYSTVDDYEFFYRPNEGNKVFTGGLLTKSQIIKQVSDSQILIKASKKNIGREYRFLVVDREVIDGCKYDDGYSINKIPRAKEYLNSTLQNPSLFLPDRTFTVDLGENLDTNELGVIELNSFSCANLYSMNMDKVVPAINDLAKQMYIQNND